MMVFSCCEAPEQGSELLYQMLNYIFEGDGSDEEPAPSGVNTLAVPP